MIFVFFGLCILASLWVAYQLTHAPDMPDYEEASREQQEREDFVE